MRMGTLNDFDNLPFRTPAAVVSDQPRAHAVVVHHFLHLRARQKQIGFAIVARQEAIPLPMALDAAGNEAGHGIARPRPLASKWICSSRAIAARRAENPSRALRRTASI